MSYQRVIPRDLFNEANLLKCYGQMWLNLERLNLSSVSLDEDDDGSAFDVLQSDDDGSTWIQNLTLTVRDQIVSLFRPLNSREAFPLMLRLCNHIDTVEISVFNDDGSFTADMVAFLTQPE